MAKVQLIRIGLGEALNFVPLKEDFADNPPKYFTLSPSQDPLYPSEEGWEDVTYYTGRKVGLYSNRKGEGDSWVYVLSNESMPGLYKIGSTYKNPEKRAKQLSRNTGVPTEFKIEFAFKCFNSEGLEKEVHKYFELCRVTKDREFFQLSLSEVKQVIEKIGKKYL